MEIERGRRNELRKNGRVEKTLIFRRIRIRQWKEEKGIEEERPEEEEEEPTLVI